MKFNVLAIAVVAVGLGLGASAHALSSSGSQPTSDRNVSLASSSQGSTISFLGYSFSIAGAGNYQQYIDAATSALQPQNGRYAFKWGHRKPKPPGDAGYVPEPGAVGVFSVGLLVAGALIRRLGRKA